MGLVLNPVAFRIGHKVTWADAWYMHRMYYPEFLHNVLLIKTLVYYCLFNVYPGRRNSTWMYSHLTLVLYNYKIFINVYFYSLFDTYNLKQLVKQLKWKRFLKIKLKTFWLKKKLLHLNFVAQKIFLVMQIIKLKIEDVMLDSLDYKYSFWKVRKLIRLKRKFGPNWTSHESITMMKRVLHNFMYGYNLYGFEYLANYYNKIYKKTQRFRYSDGYKLKSRQKDLLYLKFNYRYLFFVFAFADFVSKEYNPSYPYKVFKKRSYVLFLRLFYNWFVLRPLLKELGKFTKLIILKLGYNVKINMISLRNASISAFFIARFFAYAMKFKFNFKDMMKPFKKTLRKLMFIKSKILKKKKLKKLNIYKKVLTNRINISKIFFFNVMNIIVGGLLLKLKKFNFRIFLFKRDIEEEGLRDLQTVKYLFLSFLINKSLVLNKKLKSYWFYKNIKYKNLKMIQKIVKKKK